MCIKTVHLDVITDNLYLNSKLYDSILLFVCYISNHTDISIIFILYLKRFVIIL